MQPVSSAQQMPAPRPMHGPPVGQGANRPGNSAQSVGHQAKAAVAAATEAGQEVPKNAQGLAASAIARGADPATLFAAMVEEPQPEATQPVADPVDAAATDEPPVAEAPLTGESAPAAPPPDEPAPEPITGSTTGSATQSTTESPTGSLEVAPPILTDAEAALALLLENDEGDP